MIQRKQTLYLLTAAILLAFNLFMPFMDTDEIIFSAFEFQQNTVEAQAIAVKIFPLAVYLILLIAINLFTIFLFKNRPLQMRFTIFLIIFTLGFYGLLMFYHYMISQFIALDFKDYSYALITPLLAAVFDFMAYGGIKKDEKLIRDSERLR